MSWIIKYKKKCRKEKNKNRVFLCKTERYDKHVREKLRHKMRDTKKALFFPVQDDDDPIEVLCKRTTIIPKEMQKFCFCDSPNECNNFKKNYGNIIATYTRYECNDYHYTDYIVIVTLQKHVGFHTTVCRFRF